MLAGSRASPLVVALGSLVAASVLHAQDLTFSPAATSKPFFGWSVALSTERAVVGAAGGPAHVYVTDGMAWTEEAQLFASAGALDDGFGFSMAIDSDTVVVGAPNDDGTGGEQTGAAYVFVRTGSVWSEQAKLVAADPHPYDRFGWRVAVFGDTIIVGAPDDDGPGGLNAGSAYVFVKIGGDWTQQAKLTAPDSRDNDRFGCAVAIAGDTALIGASGGHQGNGGAQEGTAYVFVRQGTIWTQQARLATADGVDGHRFGASVALSGNAALIGADNAGPNNGFRCGWAYVFERSGTSWAQQARLAASDATHGDNFGGTVALSGNLAVIGAQGDSNYQQGSGAGYVFSRAGSVWVQQEKLTAEGASADARLGSSVGLQGGRALLGAPNHLGSMGVCYLWSLPASPPPPVAAFSGSPLRGRAPLTVSFNDASTGAVSTWSWSFGNGYYSSVQNPVFTFQEPGIYDVSLTVSGPDGVGHAVEYDYIEVLPGGPWVRRVELR